MNIHTFFLIKCKYDKLLKKNLDKKFHRLDTIVSSNYIQLNININILISPLIS